MKLLFWNTYGNKKINPYIEGIVDDSDADLLVLSEYQADKKELSIALSEGRQQLVESNTIGCDRINIWGNYMDIEAGIQSKYYSVQIINNKVILCGIHLVSDLHGDRSQERLAIIQDMMYEVKKIEEKLQTHYIIIMGDMNEMPYESGCLNANGFHGLPVLSIDDRPSRMVNDIEYRKFYNPMWNFFGNFAHPPGTYYSNQSKLSSPMWYMYDQVIISQEVLPWFRHSSLKIITATKMSSLMDKKGCPNKEISDHFPIVCEIDNQMFS